MEFLLLALGFVVWMIIGAYVVRFTVAHWMPVLPNTETTILAAVAAALWPLVVIVMVLGISGIIARGKKPPS